MNIWGDEYWELFYFSAAAKVRIIHDNLKLIDRLETEKWLELKSKQTGE